MRRARLGARAGNNGPSESRRKLEAVQQKFHPTPNPLQREEELGILQPTNAEQQQKLTLALERLAQNTNNQATKNAIELYKMQITNGTLSDQIKLDFVRRFYFWLVGRGTDEDHKKTLWGRGNAAVYNPEVAAYIEAFGSKRLQYAQQLVLLANRVPPTLNGYYLYFKYIVGGKLRHIEKDGKKYWDMSNDDYLDDFEMFQQVFGDPEVGYKALIEPAATGNPIKPDDAGFAPTSTAVDPYPKTSKEREFWAKSERGGFAGNEEQRFDRMVRNVAAITAVDAYGAGTGIAAKQQAAATASTGDPAQQVAGDDVGVSISEDEVARRVAENDRKWADARFAAEQEHLRRMAEARAQGEAAMDRARQEEAARIRLEEQAAARTAELQRQLDEMRKKEVPEKEKQELGEPAVDEEKENLKRDKERLQEEQRAAVAYLEGMQKELKRLQAQVDEQFFTPPTSPVPPRAAVEDTSKQEELQAARDRVTALEQQLKEAQPHPRVEEERKQRLVAAAKEADDARKAAAAAEERAQKLASELKGSLPASEAEALRQDRATMETQLREQDAIRQQLEARLENANQAWAEQETTLNTLREAWGVLDKKVQEDRAELERLRKAPTDKPTVVEMDQHAEEQLKLHQRQKRELEDKLAQAERLAAQAKATSEDLQQRYEEALLEGSKTRSYAKAMEGHVKRFRESELKARAEADQLREQAVKAAGYAEQSRHFQALYQQEAAKAAAQEQQIAKLAEELGKHQQQTPPAEPAQLRSTPLRKEAREAEGSNEREARRRTSAAVKASQARVEEQTPADQEESDLFVEGVSHTFAYRHRSGGKPNSATNYPVGPASVKGLIHKYGKSAPKLFMSDMTVYDKDTDSTYIFTIKSDADYHAFLDALEREDLVWYRKKAGKAVQ